MPSSTVNFSSVSILLADANHQGMDILTQILSGFGARHLHRCETFEDACATLKRKPFDLIITDASLDEQDGYRLVNWLRHSGAEPNNMASAVIVAGHTPARDIARARDCGANYVVAKPLTPQVLIDRLVWLTRDSRPFVQTPTYIGPDRRWHSVGPPAGMRGRRATDLSGKLGAAVEPNLDQSDIDSFFKPNKVNL